MSARKAYSRYRQATVDTASPGKLVVMLYDGAVRFLEDSLGHLEAKRPKEAHEALVRVENIVCELMSSLDMERGGRIAENLLALYEFMHRRLVEANLRKDPVPAREVLSLLTNLRDAWARAVEIHAQEQFRARQGASAEGEARPAQPRASGYGATAGAKPAVAPPESAGADAPPLPAGGFTIVT